MKIKKDLIVKVVKACFWKILLFLALFPLAHPACGQQSTNVADMYAYLHFNPLATNCGVLLQISDIHMALDDTELAGHIVTNIDTRLSAMVNALSPQPTAMLLTGDLCVAGATAFGLKDYEPEASNEMVLARTTLQQFTNFPLYIIPGNHDNPAYEITNAALFNSIFPNISRFTNFTVAGLPIVALDGHGGGWLDPEEQAWLAGLRKTMDHGKQVMVAIHQPIFQGFATDARESRRDIFWFLKPWTAPVWIACGHDHLRDITQYPVGMTVATQYICPSAQNWLNPTSDPRSPAACGFYLWCITNGTVQGVIEGILTNQNYYATGIDAYRTPAPDLYDGLTNVLFLAEEGHFDRSAYHVSVVGGWDVTYWRSYVTTYTCELPMAAYPTATRAFLMGAPLDSFFYLGTNTNSWRSVPLEFRSSGGVAAVAIPPDLRTGRLFFMASNSTDTFFAGGFGLGTTNPMTDFQAWAGVTTGDSSIAPTTVLTNAGGIPAWDAYLYGLDATHVETLREQSGYPFLGTLPFVSSQVLRFGGRANLAYQVLKAPSPAGSWSPASIGSSLLTNGWQEYTLTNSAHAAFYRIGAAHP